MRDSKGIFVTCGATVPFAKLIESVISKEFVEFIVNDCKFNRLVIQYGLRYSEQFQQLMFELYGEEDITWRKIHHGYKQQEHDGDTGNGGFYFEYRIMKWDFVIIGLEYSNKVQELISESRLVISHAGTGSILDTLRHNSSDNTEGAQTPLIVVINDQLMDNHQEQIANKFSERKYLISCRSNDMLIKELMQGIADLANGKIRLRPFPQSYNEQFANMLVALSKH